MLAWGILRKLRKDERMMALEQWFQGLRQRLQRSTRRLLEVMDIFIIFYCGDGLMNINMLNIQLHTLNMCSLLQGNYIFIKLLK